MIKVMIADDQELIRQSLQIVLSTHEDLKVVDAVENGFAVLESIKKERPDVILMDIRMPEMDGVYCTKAVKEKRFRQDLLYRLHDFEITVPPLRDCQEDIMPLAEFFREIANRELECDVIGFDGEARKTLLTHV